MLTVEYGSKHISQAALASSQTYPYKKRSDMEACEASVAGGARCEPRRFTRKKKQLHSGGEVRKLLWDTGSPTHKCCRWPDCQLESYTTGTHLSRIVERACSSMDMESCKVAM